MPKDAVAMLKEQHATARDLLEAIVHTTDRGVKTRGELLQKIEKELSHHMLLEEEIFYPAFKAAVERKKDKRLYYEAREEHNAAKKVLKDVRQADPATVAFGGKVKVLKELVEHHMEEEESEMFPMVRELFSKEELVELGEKMEARKVALENGRAWDRTATATSA